MSFGTVLQAYRLGYRISDKRGALVRLGEVDERTVNVTLVPLHQRVPKSSKRGAIHWVWWESEEKGEDVLDLIPAIRNVRKVNKTVSFDVDRETGERIWR